MKLDPFPRVFWTLVCCLFGIGLFTHCHQPPQPARAAGVATSTSALTVVDHPDHPETIEGSSHFVITAEGRDQTEEIEAVLDMLAARGGGSITFRAGVESGLIFLKKKDAYGYAIKAKGIDNVTWRCEGGVTFKRLPYPGAARTKDFASIWIVDSHDVRFEGCNWDGGLREFPQDEQSHILDFRADREEVYNIWVINNDFAWYEGDAVRLLGNANGPLLRDVYIDGNSMHDNLRSGVGIQRAVQRVSITNNKCWNCSDQCIDFEPSGANSAPVTDILISGNWFGPNASLALTIAGTKRQPDIEKRATRRIVISNNVMQGGVNILWARDVRLDGNIIEAQAVAMLNKVLPDGRISEELEPREGGKTHGVIINGEVQRVYIESNTITQKDGDKYGVSISRDHGDVIRGITVRDNRILGPQGRGLRLATVEDAVVMGNQIRGGMVLEAENDPSVKATIQMNTFEDSGPCIRLRGRDHGIKDVLIEGNRCYGSKMVDSKGMTEDIKLGTNW